MPHSKRLPFAYSLVEILGPLSQDFFVRREGDHVYLRGENYDQSG